MAGWLPHHWCCRSKWNYKLCVHSWRGFQPGHCHISLAEAASVYRSMLLALIPVILFKHIFFVISTSIHSLANQKTCVYSPNNSLLFFSSHMILFLPNHSMWKVAFLFPCQILPALAAYASSWWPSGLPDAQLQPKDSLSVCLTPSPSGTWIVPAYQALWNFVQVCPVVRPWNSPESQFIWKLTAEFLSECWLQKGIRIFLLLYY